MKKYAFLLCMSICNLVFGQKVVPPANSLGAARFSDGFYRIRACKNGRFIGVTKGLIKQPGNPVELWNPDKDNVTYTFLIEYHNDHDSKVGPYYTIKLKDNPKMALCLQSYEQNNYPLKIFPYSGGIDFKWYFFYDKASDRWFISSAWNGRIFDFGDRNKDGAPIVLFDRHDGEGVYFDLFHEESFQ